MDSAHLIHHKITTNTKLYQRNIHTTLHGTINRNVHSTFEKLLICTALAVYIMEIKPEVVLVKVQCQELNRQHETNFDHRNDSAMTAENLSQ